MLNKLEEFVIQGCHGNISDKVSCTYKSYSESYHGDLLGFGST